MIMNRSAHTIVRNILLITLIIHFNKAYSQESFNDIGVDISNISYEEAIEFSLLNSTRLTIKTLEEKQEKEKLKQISLGYLPNVYLTSDLRRNLIIPTTPIPASMLNPNADSDELMYMRFNTPWNSTAGINMSFDIFNPQTFGKRVEQRQQAKIGTLDTDIEIDNIKNATSLAYIDCLIAKHQNEYFIADTLYYHEILKEATKLYSLGKISLVDKNNAEVDMNNSISKFIQSEEIYTESKLNLLKELGISADKNNVDKLSPSESIEQIYNKLLLDFTSVESSLSQIRQNEIIKLASIRSNNAMLRYLPSITLTGYYGANYFDHSLSIGNNDKWFGNSFVALTLKIPISESISNSKYVSQLKIQEMIERQKQLELQNNRDSDIEKELSTIASNIKEYEIRKRNMELLKQNVQAKSKQFEKGHILQSELLRERAFEQNSFQEYLKAAHEAIYSFIMIKSM